MVLASLPPIGASLVVGFLMSLFQATTQIQESTLVGGAQAVRGGAGAGASRGRGSPASSPASRTSCCWSSPRWRDEPRAPSRTARAAEPAHRRGGAVLRRACCRWPSCARCWEGRRRRRRSSSALVLSLSLFLHLVAGVELPAARGDAGDAGRRSRCKEMVYGTSVGLVAALPFDAARMGGRFIDLFRGTSAEASLPMAGSRESATGDGFTSCSWRWW